MDIDLTEEEIKFLIQSCVCNYVDGTDDVKDIIKPTMALQLIGKLIYDGGVSKSFFYDAKKIATLSAPIRKKLFMGAGNYSIGDLNNLHKRLQFAAHQLGGLEQNGGMGTEYDYDMEDVCTKNIIDVMKDILIAFNINPEDLIE